MYGSYFKLILYPTNNCSRTSGGHRGSVRAHSERYKTYAGLSTCNEFFFYNKVPDALFRILARANSDDRVDSDDAVISYYPFGYQCS